MNIQWWLAEVDQYGNAKLVDGAHSDRAGADRAKYLIDRLGLANDRKLMVAKAELSEPQPTSEGVDMEALAACNEMGMRPKDA